MCADGLSDRQRPTTTMEDPIIKETGRPEDEVDVAVICWFLTLTPVERLATMQEYVREYLESGQPIESMPIQLQVKPIIIPARSSDE